MTLTTLIAVNAVLAALAVWGIVHLLAAAIAADRPKTRPRARRPHAERRPVPADRPGV